MHRPLPLLAGLAIAGRGGEDAEEPPAEAGFNVAVHAEEGAGDEWAEEGVHAPGEEGPLGTHFHTLEHGHKGTQPVPALAP